jgi:hypothetical protein
LRDSLSSSLSSGGRHRSAGGHVIGSVNRSYTSGDGRDCGRRAAIPWQHLAVLDRPRFCKKR